ncbi:MAG: ROK family protein [Patescibacteria group bacterium]
MKYAIGIDLGGSKIEGILANEQGKIIKQLRQPTQSFKTRKVILANIDLVVSSLLTVARAKGLKVKGLGVGVPGSIDRNGRLQFVPNIRKLRGFNLQQYLEKKYQLRVILEHDPNCFALAETLYGAAKNKKVVVGMIWGTGLSCGLVINKKIYHGATGLAGEIGHTVVDPKAKVKCGCGYAGDLESFISWKKLIEYYQLWHGQEKNVEAKYIMTNQHDPVAKKVREQAVDYFVLAIALIANLLNPDIVVLGGGVSYRLDPIKINKMVQSRVAQPIKNTFKVVRYKIGDSAGSLGAAALVINNY